MTTAHDAVILGRRDDGLRGARDGDRQPWRDVGRRAERPSPRAAAGGAAAGGGPAAAAGAALSSIADAQRYVRRELTALASVTRLRMLSNACMAYGAGLPPG